MNTILQRVGNREISKSQLFKLVEEDFSLLPQVFEGTFSPKATIRYSCGAVIMNLSEKYPDKLYPYIENVITLMDSKHRILKWNALAAIANLTAVDSEGKFDVIFDKYYSHLNDQYMVTVANTVVNSAIIVVNKPYLADRIAANLLKVEDLQTTPHLTDGCKLVISEKAIETFNTLIQYTPNKKKLIEFAQKHLNSSRASLRKKAHDFVEKFSN